MATNKVKMDSFNPVKPMVNPISQMVAEQLKKEHPERFKGKKNNAWLKVFADIETDTKLSKKDKEKKNSRHFI